MKDIIEINLRALDEVSRYKIATVLDYILNEIPDETNEEALDMLRKFKED